MFTALLSSMQHCFGGVRVAPGLWSDVEVTLHAGVEGRNGGIKTSGSELVATATPRPADHGPRPRRRLVITVSA